MTLKFLSLGTVTVQGPSKNNPSPSKLCNVRISIDMPSKLAILPI
ncbi:hypothetical protein NSA27_06380 [Clostridium tepidum]|jgi:hypothetical protein|nr:hypothetical protein [Clostridium tepidum]MCR1934319.1 hypothetical protein [Clostridium tepidum]